MLSSRYGVKIPELIYDGLVTLAFLCVLVMTDVREMKHRLGYLYLTFLFHNSKRSYKISIISFFFLSVHL